MNKESIKIIFQGLKKDLEKKLLKSYTNKLKL